MKPNDPVITQSALESTLDKRFEKQTQVLLKGFEKLLAFEVDKAKEEIDTNARKYRDQILTREVTTSAELEQIREDQVFIKNDIENLKNKVQN